MIRNISQTNNAAQMKLQQELTKMKTSQDFAQIMKEKLETGSTLQFSKHAAQRVEQRGMEMSENLLRDLGNAVQKARIKGARDVAVIADSGAFIVNVPNNVVITAMDRKEMKENIFTNIDSAVII